MAKEVIETSCSGHGMTAIELVQLPQRRVLRVSSEQCICLDVEVLRLVPRFAEAGVKGGLDLVTPCRLRNHSTI
jgi:hypothetical protein